MCINAINTQYFIVKEWKEEGAMNMQMPYVTMLFVLVMELFIHSFIHSSVAHLFLFQFEVLQWAPRAKCMQISIITYGALTFPIPIPTIDV